MSLWLNGWAISCALHASFVPPEVVVDVRALRSGLTVSGAVEQDLVLSACPLIPEFAFLRHCGIRYSWQAGLLQWC